MNIQELGSKINSEKGQKIYLVIIIILVALSSYGLGRLSKMEENKPPVRIIENSATAITSNIPDTNKSQIGNYVASKNGSKYHLPWCSGAQRMKEENKIWFETKEDAERAGYGPAANCKGL